MKNYKLADWNNFEQLLNHYDDDKDRSDIDKMAEAIVNYKIFDEVILHEAEKKINERISHKNVTDAMQRRLEVALKGHIGNMIENMRKFELFALKLQLFNTQLGLGNSEQRKLSKNTDQVQQMRSILNQQKSQKYSQTLYRVLPDKQKMMLRAIV